MFLINSCSVNIFPALSRDVWFLVGSLIGLSDLSPTRDGIQGALVEHLTEVRCDRAYLVSNSELLVSISREVVVGRGEPKALFGMVNFWERRYKMV